MPVDWIYTRTTRATVELDGGKRGKAKRRAANKRARAARRHNR